jgi:hypothetical protein
MVRKRSYEVAGALPRLGQIVLDGLRARDDRRPRLHLHETAHAIRERHHGGKRDGLLRIEVHRLDVMAHLEHAAALRCLRLGRADIGRTHDRRSGTELDEVTTGQRHVFPPAPDADGASRRGERSG